MSNVPNNPISSGHFSFINKLIGQAKSINKPIQFISVTFCLLFILLLFNARIETEALQFILVLLPFALLLIVFNDSTLDKISASSSSMIILVGLLVLGSFIPAVAIGLSSLPDSRDGIAGSPSSFFSAPGRQKKAEQARNDNIRMQSYLENYNITAKYYEQDLGKALGSDATGDRLSETLSLRKDMDAMAVKIIEAKKSSSEKVYGSGGVSDEVSRFEQCQVDLWSMKYLWQVVLIVYGGFGPTKNLDQIINIKDLPSDPELASSISKIRYSQTESDLISALGSSIVGKPINSFDVKDVDHIRQAFNALGYLGETSNARSSEEILRRYQLSLSKYVPIAQQSQPFYKLAYAPMTAQLGIYVSLYETGLLDFRKFILKYAPEQTKPMITDLLSRQITLVTATDAQAFTEDLIRQEKSSGVDTATPGIILFRLRDDFQKSTGDSAHVSQVLQSKSAEAFFVGQLEMSLDVTETNNARELFGEISILGSRSGRYQGLVEDYLNYYNVFESRTIVNALGS